MKPIVLEELTSPGCHNCRAFEEFWQTVEKDWPNVTIQRKDITTPEGQALAGRHSIMASPGIVLNDEFFSTGGVDRAALLAKLKELS